MSLVAQVPKTAIILPSNMKVVGTSPLILQKIKRRVKKFKTSVATRKKIAAASRKFKIPILTSIAVGPALLISIRTAMTQVGIVNQISQFLRTMLRFYTGITITAGGGASFKAKDALVGLGPLFGVLVLKLIARKTITKLGRTASQLQLPVSAS